MDKKFIDQIHLIVMSNIADEKFGAPKLASLLGLSQSQTLKKVRAETGKSVNQYIRELRLKQATKLIKKTDLTNAEISYKVGFSSQSYFNKTFSCKISAPDKSWAIEEEIRGGIVTVKMRPKDKDIFFTLVLFAVPPGTSAKTILDGRLKMIANRAKNFKKLEEGEIEIAGQKLPRVVFQMTIEEQLIYKDENCLLIDGVNAYLFKFLTPEDCFSELRTYFQKILDSFEIFK